MKKFVLLSALLGISLFVCAQKKKKGKDKESYVDYQQPEAVADTATRFIGVIKYRITTDDPSTRDSMFVIVGEDRIRVVMFNPGYKENEVFRDNMIANFRDSTFLVLDDRKKTYKRERLGARNAGTEINLLNQRKTARVLNIVCPEYSGEMIMKDGETFEAAALISKQHSFIPVETYNFLNIQPVVLDYKLVLGYRTRTTDNEHTYIMAYAIEPGNVDSWFDLSEYKAQ